MAFDFRFINAEQLRSDPRFGSWYATVGRQPTWTWRIAGVVALLVFVVPILLLTLAALLAFLVVFAVLSIAHRIGTAVCSLFAAPSRDLQRPSDSDATAAGSDGRVNVRVIRSD